MGEEELKELKEVLKEIRDELREIRKEIKQSKQSQSIQTTSEEPPVVYTVPYHYIEIRSFKDFVIFCDIYCNIYGIWTYSSEAW